MMLQLCPPKGVEADGKVSQGVQMCLQNRREFLWRSIALTRRRYLGPSSYCTVLGICLNSDCVEGGAASCLPPGDDNDSSDVAAIAENPLVTLGGS
jgi:hypothetical protein